MSAAFPHAGHEAGERGREDDGPAAPPAVDAALLAAAGETIRVGSRSFAAAARLLPAEARADALLLYAWCRHCDDEVDGQRLGHRGGDGHSAGGPRTADAADTVDAVDAATPGTRLASVRDATLAVLRGDAPCDAPHAALAAVLARHPIDPALPREHLEGFAMDVAGTRYDTLDALMVYCARVAGVVGEMMAATMGVRDAATLARAADLGLAFQLTNIARDVVDDARIDRLYLPRRWLNAAGLPTEPAALVDPTLRPWLVAPTLRLLDAAEPYYASARIGLRALPPRCAWAIGTALATYRAIGTRVRALGATAWDTRVSTSTAAKLGHAAGAMPHAARAAWSRAAGRRGGGVRLPERDLLWTRPR